MVYSEGYGYCHDWRRGFIPEVTFVNNSPFEVSIWWVSLVECVRASDLMLEPPGSCTSLLGLKSGDKSSYHFLDKQGYLVFFPSHTTMKFFIIPVESGFIYTYKNCAQHSEWVTSLSEVRNKIINFDKKRKKNGIGFKPLSPRK